MARQRRAGQAVENATPNVERAAEAGMIAEPPAEGWDGPRAMRYTMPFKLSAPDNDLDDPDLPYWLALNRVRGIGPARFRLLLDAFGTAEAAWCGTVAGWQAAGLDTQTASAFERQRHTIVPEAALERLDTLRVWALRITDLRYPRLLREIAVPPALLYVRGTLLPDDDWAVAIERTAGGAYRGDRRGGHRVRSRNPARCRQFPGAQPPHQRPVARRGGHGGTGGERGADHDALRRRAGARRLCGAGQHLQSLQHRHEPADPGRGEASAGLETPPLANGRF
jgi:hypothetical protein